MKDYEIIPFDEALMADAGALLAARHRRDRQTLPELPERFEDPSVAAGAVTASFGQAGASGVAAVRGSQMLGYMIGRPTID